MRYIALRSISAILKFAALIQFIVALVGFFSSISIINDSLNDLLAAGVPLTSELYTLILFGNGLFFATMVLGAIALFARGEAITVLIDIESNTRRTADNTAPIPDTSTGTRWYSP